MPKTVNFNDATRLAALTTAAGGAVPERLGYLLSAYEVLTAPTRVAPPEEAIMTAALSGKLTEKKLNELLPDAAIAQLVRQFRGDLGRSAQNSLLGQFHRELEAGAADELLNSLRPKFDAAAKAIAHAKSIINPESSAEHIIESGDPGLVEAWGTLRDHLAVVQKISAVARSVQPDHRVRTGRERAAGRPGDHGHDRKSRRRQLAVPAA